MVDQAFPRVGVVLQLALQTGLFENDSVVDALSALAVLAPLGMSANGFMVGLGPAGKRSEQVVGDHTQVQLVHAAAAVRLEESRQPMVVEANLLMAVEVPI